MALLTGPGEDEALEPAAAHVSKIPRKKIVLTPPQKKKRLHVA